MSHLILFFVFFKLEWSDFWDVFYVVIGFILGASAVIGAVTVIWSKVMKPFYDKWVKPIQDAEIYRTTVRESVDKIETQVDKIAFELRTNGGESLKDAINRIETKVDYANTKLKFRDQLSPNCVFEMDANARCIFANRALCDALDIDEFEFLERRWLARIEGNDKVGVLQDWMEAAENKIPLTANYLFRVAGVDRAAVVRAEPALVRKDELVGFMCLVDFKD